MSPQEKTRSDVKGQENPGQASVADCVSQVPWGIPVVTEPRASDLEGCCRMPQREQHNVSSSSGRKESQHPKAQASGDRLPSTLTE